MLLVYNRQYQQENKLFNELAKKIVKSKKIGLKYEGLASIFQLDSIDIFFILDKGHKIKVLDKGGCVVVPELNCTLTHGSTVEKQLQDVRYYRLNDLYSLACGMRNQRQLQEQKTTDSIQISQEEQVRLDKAIADRMAAEMTIKTALRRLKTIN
ncbi:MAG: hypothetical protein IKZ34_02065 [Alphaproteobacteria bacterium]|nr:hypothetical protein [Alphaproteobacteria bacterium]